ncbi:hypothetical protein AGMMS49938_12290 [Fibrobacterales bacterium]|nr:hypothetical protein AGMMS49938_12290 [Fibrobacterales bacterium]
MRYGNISSFQTGVVVPLFSLRSKESVGIGEFLDIIPFGEWAKKCGLDLIQLLPVNDTGEESSPYSARSAFALNPVYIRLQEVEGAKEILGTEPKKKDKEFAKNPRIPYIDVVRYKRTALRVIFDKREKEITANKELKKWISKNSWVESYAEFCALKAENAENSWTNWQKRDKPSDENLLFQKWMQWVAEEQFLKAVGELNKLGVKLKGDVPILINEDSADAWHYPQFFSTESRAGAPPDMFCYSGQNWGFPTYKWDELEKNNFKWWRDRVQQAAKFYHAYRIDHVLGFFRIWVVPDSEVTGILGYFVPSVPIYANELLQAGIPHETIHYLTHPNFGEEQLRIWFGYETENAKGKFFAPLQGSPGRYVLRDEFQSEKAILSLGEEQFIKDALLSAYWDRVFVPSSTSEILHPYWYWYNAPVLLTLPLHEQNVIKNIFRTEKIHIYQRTINEKSQVLACIHKHKVGVLIYIFNAVPTMPNCI